MSPFAVIHVQVCNFCQHQWLTLFSSVCDFISCPQNSSCRDQGGITFTCECDAGFESSMNGSCLGSYTYEKLMNNITYLLVFSIVSDMGCWYYDESTFKIAYSNELIIFTQVASFCLLIMLGLLMISLISPNLVLYK